MNKSTDYLANLEGFSAYANPRTIARKQGSNVLRTMQVCFAFVGVLALIKPFI